MAATNPWDETKPLGTEAANTLDTIIQTLKLDLRERLNREHVFGVSQDDDGTHRALSILAAYMTANTPYITGRGFSLTGASEVPMIDLEGTLNTSGNPDLISIRVTRTGSGGSGRAISYVVDGVERFYVDENGNISTTGTISGVAAITAIPAGVVFPHAGGTVPGGYLECDGTAVSRVTYASLFAAIGTTWGVGDGATTFNVPDFRGRTLMGSGTGPGLTARTLGQSVGEEAHPLLETELAPHVHGVTDPTHTHQYLHLTSGNDAQTGATGDIVTGFVIEATTASATGISINSAGSGTPHNNIQPTSVVKWIIKA